MFERIHKESQQIQRSKHEQDLQIQVQEMQTVAIDKLKKEFGELREKNDQKEKILMSQIMIATSNNIIKFRDWWNNTIHREKESQSWIKQAQSTFEQFTELVKYWELLNLTDSLRTNGKSIYQLNKKNQQQIIAKKDQLIGLEINVKFNWNSLKLEDFCKIIEGSELIINSTNQFQQSPYLLGFFTMQSSIEEIDLLNDISASFANEAEPVSQIKRVYHSVNSTNQINTENFEPSLSNQQFKKVGNQQNFNQQKKSQVPMKQQLYKNELRKGKTDVAEFNNLEKELLVIIRNEIKYWQVKSVKIMKSKLYYYLFIQKTLSQNENIQSVNLSQNYLTDKSIDTMLQLYQNDLKNIIPEMSNKKQRIKKLGLIITL